MGGKSNDSGSREMIQMQKEEAADARAREAERQGRIQSGLDAHQQAFEGAPVMATRGNQFDWGSQVGNTRNVGQPGTALPVGFSWANVGSPGGGGGGGGGISDWRRQSRSLQHGDELRGWTRQCRDEPDQLLHPQPARQHRRDFSRHQIC